MNVKTCPSFLKDMPRLCGAGQNAHRYGRAIELIFDAEARGDADFSENSIDLDDPANRIEVLFAFPGDEKKKQLCRDIVTHMMLKHHVEDHSRDIAEESVMSLESSIDERLAEPENAEIKAAVAAAPRSWWAN